MTTPLRPRTAALKEIIEFALSVGAISYDGDAWYAASDEGGAGLGYERCEASFAAARQALNDLSIEAEAAARIFAALPAALFETHMLDSLDYSSPADCADLAAALVAAIEAQLSRERGEEG